MFVLGHTQGGFTVNYPHLLDEASRHACHVLSHAVEHDLVVEATTEGEEAWLTALTESARDFRAFQEQCTPGYYNNEGQGPGAFLGRGYPYGPSAYFAYIDKWRASGTFDGLEFR
jgi:hypothetical protein